MKKWSGRRKKVTIVIVVAILAIAAIGTFILLQNKEGTPSSSNDEVVSREDAQDETPSSPTPEGTVEDGRSEDSSAEDIDPATLATIDIEPASLTVSYVKGVGGFEYEVLRLSEGRRSVELRNADLVGTKCDQDTGVFVSIVQSPNESEQATIEKTTKVDGVTYGLSIASPTCTDEPELLKKYQDAFTKPFSLLKKLN